jgi:hypothetical protein
VRAGEARKPVRPAGRASPSLGVMTQPRTRTLLGGAYLVILVELLRPVLDNPHHIPSPVVTAAVVAFVLWNVAALVLMEPRRSLLILAALNAIVGLASLVAASIQLVAGAVPSRDFDTDIALIFFVGLVPLVAAAYFFVAGR